MKDKWKRNVKCVLAATLVFALVMLIPEYDGMSKQELQKEVIVAVLDTGYDIEHGLAERLVDGIDLTGDMNLTDENGHGTEIANVILENTNDSVKVMPIKVAGEEGTSTALRLYRGICYAVEHQADVIHISMTAYQSAHTAILEEAVAKAYIQDIPVVVCAGNYDTDIACYTPANIEKTIAVSAVNVNQKRDEYSNFGKDVDYCAYGSMKVTGMNGENTIVSGTSVSAAIVSSVTAELLCERGNVGIEELRELLNERAEDLGDVGYDKYFGNGLLTLSSVSAEQEKITDPVSSKLLTSDYQKLTVDELNELLLDASDLDKRRFLDQLDKTERTRVLKKKNILFSQSHTAIVYDVTKVGVKEEKRFEGTLYEYLYSEFFEEFVVQKNLEKEYHDKQHILYMGSEKESCYVKFKTNQNDKKAKMNVWVKPDKKVEKTADYTIYVSATNNGAFHFDNIKIGERYEMASDSGVALGGVHITNIEIEKEVHAKTSMNQSKTCGWQRIVEKENVTDDTNGGLGGFTSMEQKCNEDKIKATFLFTNNDGEHSENDKALIYQLNFEKAGEKKDEWGEWQIVKEPTCLQGGKQKQERKILCKECKQVVRTEIHERNITPRGHGFSGGYIYATDPKSGIENGIRYRQCKWSCHEAGWQSDFQYLQEIYYRYMDAQGNYPDYTILTSNYYAIGQTVNGYRWEDKNGMSVYQPIELGNRLTEDMAVRTYVEIPRKTYQIEFDANDGSGTIESMNHVTMKAGNEFLVNPTYLPVNQERIHKTGNAFLGWSLNRNGEVQYTDGAKLTENLTFEDGEIIKLYAVWRPVVYQIQLDSQNADESGTKEVYQKYTVGYFKEKESKNHFHGDRIVIPAKQDGDRRQLFLGYYTKKDGQGHLMINRDGILIPNINQMGNYRYFVKDDIVYAHWQDMHAVMYEDNLSEKEKQIVGEDTILPNVKWKEKGKDITVSYEMAEVEDENYKKIYRFLGWSLTPEIQSLEELVLTPEKKSCTFSKDEDVTLYAQWDSSFYISYIGNGQSGGEDCRELIADAAGRCKFYANDGTNVFEKTIKRETIDIATGKTADDNGNAYTEEIPYRFLGWSMYKNKKEQENPLIGWLELEKEYECSELFSLAQTVKKQNVELGLTFGLPSDDYQSSEVIQEIEGMPYVNMYAMWDEFPQIKACDLYFPLSDAQKGILTEEYLLSQAEATDLELVHVTDENGTFVYGEDVSRNTMYKIMDYQESDFLGAEENVSMTITYYAKDKTGNETTKMVTIHLVDTQAKEYNSGNVRFISKEYLNTLSEDSVWKTDEYATVLSNALENQKNARQIWKFTHEQVEKVKEFLDGKGMIGTQQEFLDQFAECRIQ